MRKLIFLFTLLIILFTIATIHAQEIITAAKEGNLGKVKELIEKDSQLINTKDANGRTLIHWACRGVHFEVIKYLVENGANVNAKDNNMNTPLISISSRGHIEAAKFLLDNGADIHAESNEFSRTALFYSVLGGHTEVTELLLRKGAKVNINVGFGRTPLYYAVDKGHTEIAKLLILGGADKNFIMNDGLSLLHLAVISNNIEMVRTLVDLKCDINAKQRFGLTPLHLAANYGTVEITNLLINSGADLNVKSTDGGTPYNYAIASNNKEIADLLLKNNSNINSWDFPEIKDAYLNVEKPELEPTVFSPEDVILNPYTPHGGIAFSNNNEEIFWTRNSASMGSKIWYMRKIENRWLPPQIFTPSDKYSEEDPFFSPDGQKLFFSSNRPYDNDSVSERHDIWFVEKKGGEWCEPKATGIQKYIEDAEVSGASVSKYGTLYFTVIKNENDNEIVDIYSSKFNNGIYEKPEKLSESVNTSYMDLSPFIAADESYIIFNSHRPKGGNLICFKNQDNSWCEPQNLDKVLPDCIISCQGISPDGQYLFFNGVKNDIVDHYWVSSKIIEELKQKELK